MIFGSLITFVAGVLTLFAGKLLKRKTAARIIAGGIFPVLLNAFLLPLIWYFCYGELEYAYYLQVLFLLASEGASVYVFGTVFYLAIKRLREKNVDFLL